MPRSPWLASAGCTKKAGVPVEAKVAAILRPTWPDLPMPGDDHPALAARISSTAAVKAAPERLELRPRARDAAALGLERPQRRGNGVVGSSLPDDFAISGFVLAMLCPRSRSGAIRPETASPSTAAAGEATRRRDLNASLTIIVLTPLTTFSHRGNSRAVVIRTSSYEFVGVSLAVMSGPAPGRRLRAWHFRALLPCLF